MNVLIDIGHPAHVHLFKYFAKKMQLKGHQILFTVRDKEIEIYLLKKYELKYISLGKKRRTKIAKIWGLIEYTVRIYLISLKFKPNLYLSHGSIYAAWTSFLMRKPHISMEDTGNWEQVRLYKPFTSTILTSTSFSIKYGQKQIFYSCQYA